MAALLSSDMEPQNIYAIVLAGGSGTRFWPASRKSNPKQFLALGSDPHESLLVATVRRLGFLCPWQRIYVATGEHLREATRNALPALPEENVLCEPLARNTAPCIGWATHVVARKDPTAIVMVFPADHCIENIEEFQSTVKEACHWANQDFFVTIGIQPSRAETGYGYIELGETLNHTSFRSQGFVEKPDADKATKFLNGGKHLWNSGMFFFRASVMKQAIARHLPQLARGLAQLDEASVTHSEQMLLPSVFESVASISIDHGVMEHVSPVAVVRAEMGWNDMGSWESGWELAAGKDENQNAAPSNAIFVDSKRNFVQMLGQANTKAKTVALVGVDDLIVVETEDALLVMRRDRSQDVRHVVEQLRQKNQTLL